MLEVAVNPGPTPQAAPRDDMKQARSATETIRIVMPVVLMGLATVTCSLFFLLWPTGRADHPPTETVLHPARIFMPGGTDGAAGLIRAIVDVSIYGVVLAGLASLVMAATGRRTALIALMAVGLLGLTYVSGMALYTGPMVSVCGFTMILFGGLIAWIATSRIEPVTDQVNPVSTAEPIAVQEQPAAPPVQAVEVEEKPTEESPGPGLDFTRSEPSETPDRVE